MKVPTRLTRIISTISHNPVKQQIDYLLEVYEELITVVIKSSRKPEDAKAESLEKLKKDIDDAEILINIASRYQDTVQFLSDMVLEPTSVEKKGDYLNISTIHSAKGIEYDSVWLLALVEGQFPKCKPDSIEDPEELRCLYVALTRAKEYLKIVVPEKVMAKGTPMDAELSHHSSRGICVS